MPPQPKDGWTWGKIPAVWPGSVGDRAWYRRTFMVPEGLKGRRVAVAFGFVNTHADVYVDGRKAGGCSFPCGEVDVTDLLRPGTRQELAIDVTAFPQSRKTLDYNAPDRAEYMLSHFLDWMNVYTPERMVCYADAPIPEDDPYRYYRW